MRRNLVTLHQLVCVLRSVFLQIRAFTHSASELLLLSELFQYSNNERKTIKDTHIELSFERDEGSIFEEDSFKRCLDVHY